jgi:hypothetical protein
MQNKFKMFWVDSETGCWNWTGFITKKGYSGNVRWRGKNIPAYSAFYREFVDAFPVEGYEMDHLCKNRNCVNPKHLESVSHKTNCRRGSATKLSLSDAEKIRSLLKKGNKRTEVALMFGVSKSLIDKVDQGVSWKD